jgi:hypothetical protein
MAKQNAGYSGTPLIKKLGLKSNYQCFIFNDPPQYWNWLSPLPEKVKVNKMLCDELDFIHLFVKEKKVFEKEFLKSKKHLKKDGTLWISWPKRASKVVTDLDENSIRDFGLANGLVDVKVCAVDEVWSGLKFMFRTKDR